MRVNLMYKRHAMKTRPDERGVIDHGRLRLKLTPIREWLPVAGNIVAEPVRYTLTREFPINARKVLLDFTILANGRRV